MKIVLVALNAKYIHSSLALRYLQAYCSPLEPDIVVKEYTINNGLLEILSDIYPEQPEVIGLSCYIWNIEMVMNLAGLIKKVLPQVIIVLGGPEVSFDPHALMQKHQSVDYIVQGEGERTLYLLLEALKDGHEPNNIAGLAYRQGKAVMVCTGTPILPALDDVPFPYRDEDMIELKDKIIYYESSRGCPFSCQYCLSSATQGVRFLSLERTLSDLAFFIAHNVRQVKFVDRTFNARKEHYLPILKFLATAHCDTNFHFEIAVDILDEETLDFLKGVPVGRFQFEIGIQSTNEPSLEAICRHNNWSKIVTYVRQINSYHNIHLHLDLIVGLPKEDYQQFAKSFNDVYDLKPDMLQLGFLKLLKGSGLRESGELHGYCYMDTAPYEVLSNQYMTYAEVRKLKVIEELFNNLYNNGRLKYTTDCLIREQGGDAFNFYERLAEYWEERGYNLLAHSVKSLYQHVLDFCTNIVPKSLQLCQEFLKFDALVGDHGSVRPEFLSWNIEKWETEKTNFWRNQETVRKYLPGYVFTNWRDVKKRHHIEVFMMDIPEYLNNSGEARERYTAILYSYTDKTGVQYQRISEGDFWREGE